MNFPFFVVLFEAGVLTFSNSCPVFCIFSISYLIVLIVPVFYTLHGKYTSYFFIFLRRLLFYTIYHDKAHNNHHTMAYNGLIRWHDRPYYISVRQAWMVRAAAAIVATIQKYRINLTLLLLHSSPSPFLLPLLFCNNTTCILDK